jgi:hypothetical protein
MTLEDEIAKELTKEISEEIDFEIMKDLLTDSGWYTVELSTLTGKEQSIDIKDWISEKVKEGFVSRGKTFIFKSKKEAEWFSLRWL